MKDAAARLAGQIRVAREPGATPETPITGTLQRALADPVAVELVYRDARGREVPRIVEPAGLFATPNGWYLAAWCRLRRAARSFRLDRIVRATPTAEPIVPRRLDALLRELPYDLAAPDLAEQAAEIPT